VYVDRYVHKDGRLVVVRGVEVHCAQRGRDDALLRHLGPDVTQERALSAQLSHQALHDSLTGLANRVLFEDRLSQTTLGRSPRRVERCVDVGPRQLQGGERHPRHHVGDLLLVALARRLEEVTRSSDTLCRLGATSSSTWPKD